MDARLDKALDLRAAWPIQQFGQANDDLTNNGATGCTDTVIQTITRLWGKGSWTHNGIRRKVGHTNRYTGLKASEVQAFFRAVGVPYVLRSGYNQLTADQMLAKSRLGPVLVGEMYSWHPEWYGYVYSGIRADGKPNGYAQPQSKAGKTQLSGFTGRHAFLLLGFDGSKVYVHEPNHNSGSRPEKPRYDIITPAQFRNAVASFKNNTGSTYCFVPTKYLPL